MKKLLIICIAISLVAIPSMTTIAQDEQPLIGFWDTCPTPQNLPDRVKLGLNLGLTGATSLYGIPQQHGIQLGLDEINASGYLGETELVGIFEDGGSSPETAISAMEKLVNEDRVIAVIGPTFSTQAFAADPIAQEAGVPVMGISNLAKGITDMGEYVFRNSLLDNIQMPAAVDKVIELMGIESAAIIYSDNDEFTVTGYEVFRQTLEDREIEITTEETFQTGDVDFSAQITNIIASEPDAIMVSALGAEAVPLLEQIRNLGYEGVIVGGNGLNAPALLQAANAEGVVIGAAWHISSEAEINARFVEAFTARFDFPPDQFAAQAYTAAWLMATAIRCADSPDSAAVRDALAAIRDFPSPLGAFSFDENRDPVHEPTVQIIIGGRFEILSAVTLAEVYP